MYEEIFDRHRQEKIIFNLYNAYSSCKLPHGREKQSGIVVTQERKGGLSRFPTNLSSLFVAPSYPKVV
jgi:hypothetical protein